MHLLSNNKINALFYLYEQFKICFQFLFSTFNVNIVHCPSRLTAVMYRIRIKIFIFAVPVFQCTYFCIVMFSVRACHFWMHV